MICKFLYRMTGLWAILCWNCGLLSGQQFSYLRVSTAEGLPSSEVYGVVQDDERFIWILTDNGLARFDGYTLRIYTTADGLPSNAVFRTTRDAFGRRWFLTKHNRICYFDGKQFHRFAEQIDLKHYLSSKIATEIYFSQNGNLNVLAAKGNSVVVSPESRLVDTIPDREYNLFFFRDQGQVRGDQMLTPDQRQRPLEWQSRARVRIDLPLIDTTMWIDGLGKAHPWYVGDGTEQFALAYLNDVYLFRAGKAPRKLHFSGVLNHLDLDGKHLWVSSREGLYRLDLATEVPERDTIDLPALNFSGIFRDDEGGYWVSTLDQGVFYLRSVGFRNIDLGLSGEEMNIRLLNGIGDTVLAAGQFDNNFLVVQGKLIRQLSNASPKRNDDRIRTILPLPEKRQFLIGYLVAELHRLDLRAAQPAIVPHGIGWQLDGISQSRDGHLLGARNHLLKIRADSVEIMAIKKLRYRHVAEDPQGRIWMVSEGNLFVYQEGRFTNVSATNPAYPESVTSLVFFQDSILLVGSRDRGLWAMQGTQLGPIPALDKWTGGLVKHVFVDQDDRIWLATNQGIVLLFRQDNAWKVRKFTAQDGLLSNEINQVYVHQDKVWAATSNGLTYFVVGDIPEVKRDARLHLNQLRINGAEVAIIPGQTLELSAKENTLDFQFTGISYHQWGRVRYRYGLEGFDDNRLVSLRGRVQYYKLPPGDYRFTVESSRLDGEWTPPQTLAAFRIARPWWQRWWFFLGSAAYIVTLGVLFLRWRVRAVKRREQVRTRILELEKQALQAQMNPHFLFNTLNAIQSYLSANETAKAEEYLADFSRLIRLILENSRRSEVALARELELLEKYMAFEALRFDDRIRFELRVDPALPSERITVPPMLLQPFVENAVVHGLAHTERAGRVCLRIAAESHHLRCTIEDNGIGREAAAALNRGHSRRQGVGMVITRERLRLLNERLPIDLALQVEDLHDGNRPCGTRITLKIPYQTTAAP
ncbi:MAG: histidine kinase [Bacteroidota bacterium]